MSMANPLGELDPEFSSQDAVPTPWAQALEVLRKAEVYWLSTVRPDGRPHVTPLIAVWLQDALYFCTGAGERKTRNLEHNGQCILTTGCNALEHGLDLVVESQALRMSDALTLSQVADAYLAKYGQDWRYTVRDGNFVGQQGNAAQVYKAAPIQVFAFGRGKTSSQTRWRLR